MNHRLLRAIRKSWADHKQRPFWRLVRLFIVRIFQGGGDADTEGLDLTVGLVLTLLAMPGGFVSILLFAKYGTLLQWMRGLTNVDALASALPDEYFFIVLSMATTGAAAVWKWDAIFPDRRDYQNLVPLPISTRNIFFANLVALLFLASLLALDVNALSSIFFPIVVGATQSSFSFFGTFAAIHALGVLSASVFTFFAVFALLGLLMAVLPYAMFKRLSSYIRGLVVIALVILLSSSFAVPAMLRRLQESHDSWIRFLPSLWFLALCQALRDRADPSLAVLARFVVPALAAAFAVAICVYAVSYRRYFIRIPEMSEVTSARSGAKFQWLTVPFDRLILRTPFQRGCFRFVCKTLARSEAHRLVLAGIGGLGFVLASQALLEAFAGGAGSAQRAISGSALSVPLILAFCIIVGLRIVFELPVELRSNWIFRFTLDPEKHECQSLARKVILTTVLPCVLLTLPAYFYFAGWIVGLLHTVLVVAWSILLTDAVLVRFRKLPFTCSLPTFRQHSIVTLLACVMAFFLFAVVTPQMESFAFSSSISTSISNLVWITGFLLVALLAWYVPRRIQQDDLQIEKNLIFEEIPARAVEVLQLSD
jgi:hypothetical protein